MIAMLGSGLELSVDEAGEGIPLLFLHGWPHDRTLWAGQLSGLPTHARCLAADLRGFGASSVQPPYSMDQYADDAAALLVQLGVERAVLCGLSMGGYIALAMWRRHPALVRGLILTSTRASADTPEAREKRMQVIAFVQEHGVEALAGKQLKAMVGETTFTTRPDVLEAVRNIMGAAPKAGVIGALHAMADRADSTALLAGIDVPTLVVSGAEDTIVPPEEMRTMASAIRGSRFESIRSAGHVCPYERPAAFNHVVAEFIASLIYD